MILKFLLPTAPIYLFKFCVLNMLLYLKKSCNREVIKFILIGEDATPFLIFTQLLLNKVFYVITHCLVQVRQYNLNYGKFKTLKLIKCKATISVET